MICLRNSPEILIITKHLGGTEATWCYCKQRTEGILHTCSPWCESEGHFLDKFCSLIIRLKIHFIIHVLIPGTINNQASDE